MWLSSFQHRAVNHLLNGCHKHTRSQQRSYFSFIRTAPSGYNTTANAFSRCKKHLKWVSFFQEIRLRACLLCSFGVRLILLYSPQLQFSPQAGNGCTSSEAAESQEKQEYFQYCRQRFTTCFKGAFQTVSTLAGLAKY